MPLIYNSMGGHVAHDQSGILSIVSGICALLSIANIQPYLTFVGSVVAIVSGLVSIHKKLNKKK